MSNERFWYHESWRDRESRDSMQSGHIDDKDDYDKDDDCDISIYLSGDR